MKKHIISLAYLENLVKKQEEKELKAGSQKSENTSARLKY